jgi:hypothetical protein
MSQYPLYLVLALEGLRIQARNWQAEWSMLLVEVEEW